MKIDKERALFVIASFIFLIDIIDFVVYDLLSRISTVLNIFVCAIYIIYAIAYFDGEKKNAKKSKFPIILFILLLALIIVTFSFDILYLKAAAFSVLAVPAGLLLSLPLLLPFILLIFLARSLYLQKVPKNYTKRVRLLSYIIYLAAIVFFIVCFLSGLVYKPTTLHLNDEEFLSLSAASAFSKGQNPYTTNFSAILSSNVTKTVSSASHTSNNTVLGKFVYPALSFLLLVPFALINNSGIYHFTYGGFYILFSIFIFILVMTVSYVLKYDFIKKPSVSVIIFLLVFFSSFASINNFLMLALIVIAIYKIESKYLFVILGVLASFQQEVWVVVVLFLIYVFKNYGTKKGMYTILGTLFVFILINGYFIALSPSSFVKNIFGTSNISGITSPYPVFGYSILRFYPSLFKGSIIFLLAFVAVLIMSYYFNVKELIMLFGLLPLMFLSNGIAAYYVFFVSALVISIYMDHNSKDDLKIKSKPSKKVKT